jgi:SnoaL-like domain
LLLANGSRTNAKGVAIFYHTALNEQDFKSARSHLKDDMTFLAPIASHNSVDAYLEGNEQLRSIYRIKMVLYEIKKIFMDGDHVCVFFGFRIGSAILFASGWFNVQNGKISSIRAVFNPRSIFEMSAKK